MFHDDGCAELMRGWPGTRGDFQNLTEGAERVSSCLGGVIGAGVSDNDDPQGVAPAGAAVGGE
jgi:hypothetical protein